MKIVFDVSYLQRKPAGLARYTTELLNALLTMDKANEYILHGWSHSLDLDMVGKFARPNVRNAVAKIPGMVKRFYWHRLKFPPLEKFVGDFDIFQSADPQLPPVRFGRTVASVHDLGSMRFPQFFENHMSRWNRYVVESVRRADAVVVPSENTMGDVVKLLGIGEERIHHIRYPVSRLFTPKADTVDERVRSTYNLANPYALFVGTLEPRKNVAMLVHAFEQLHERSHQDLDLVIVGKLGWLYDKTLQGIRTSPFAHKIRYLEFVSDEELAAIYRQALFFVYPSFYEGHGFPVVEAMATGKPVVVSNGSSLKEIGEGVALMIDPNDILALTNAMNTLAHDSSLRDEMSRKSLERARQFSPDSAARALLNLYESLASQ